MRQKKLDIEVGFRAYEEFRRVAGRRGMVKLAQRLGFGRKTAIAWKHGICPSVLYLAKLHYAGADVIYILTGRRNGNDDRLVCGDGTGGDSAAGGVLQGHGD